MTLDIISQNSTIIIIGLAGITVLLFLMNLISLVSIGKLKKRYKKMMKGNDNQDIEALITKHIEDIEKVKADNESLMNQYDELKSKINKAVQKTAILRYKAFEDVGSDLSFSLALLDDENSGVIVTSIYGRNESTVYAKPIDNGISRYDMSEEEEEVLQRALLK
ncbi:MAG: DUF4446 family protein [Clostridiaceae bacterium]